MATNPPRDSTLATVIKASQPSPELSGFRLLPLGIFSLDARLKLIEKAEHTIDIQYYVIADDASGNLLLQGLRDASLRGVRVRLLVDDLYTTQTQQRLRALTVMPRFEVRLFNPFCCARSGAIVRRFAASLLDFSRLNHRMHNKLFVVDGVAAIAGGRNIADEYFTRNPSQNFIDMDCFIVGAVVPQLERLFDRYWNSEASYPIAALVDPTASDAELAVNLERLVGPTRMDPLSNLPDTDVLGYGPLSEDLVAGRIGLIWGIAQAVADHPDRVMRHEAEHAYVDSAAMSVLDLLRTAKSEVMISSPYLVPGHRGMELFADLHAKQVRATVLTNSLASTDEPLVHGGYARYRPAMLRLGVDLYELSPTRATRSKRLGLHVFGGSSQGRLHAKMAVVDRSIVFFGSLNLDSRSIHKNTEMGVVVESPELAREMLRVLSISRLQSTYRVRLREDGGLQWISQDGDRELTLNEEPEASVLTKLLSVLFAGFIPEGQL